MYPIILIYDCTEGTLTVDNPRIFIPSTGTPQATDNRMCPSYIKEDGKLLNGTRGSWELKMHQRAV